mgnify:CR=1
MRQWKEVQKVLHRSAELNKRCKQSKLAALRGREAVVHLFIRRAAKP